MFMRCENCYNKSAGSLPKSLILHTHAHIYTFKTCAKEPITKDSNGLTSRLALCLF